ncbi:hypothetical protein RFI_14723 [Reticulomyxa filosa]|uniref:Uncharacterized protein n=1 Tax=Reticulomyxa filosa TaxID=46433 RepID=X6NAY9_RETFI|nr:hypothetical protein RFI_14723 [Reticulomyxa filosa]|eukprot:ETO22477.1 hypothetical protein RFI_14723 [Reticulomyxa filosa]
MFFLCAKSFKEGKKIMAGKKQNKQMVTSLANEANNLWIDSKYLKGFDIQEEKSGKNVVYQREYFTDDQFNSIKNNQIPIIFLFGDNEQDNIRQNRKEKRLGFSGQARIAGKLEFEDKLSVGIITLWHSVWRINLFIIIIFFFFERDMTSNKKFKNGNALSISCYRKFDKGSLFYSILLFNILDSLDCFCFKKKKKIGATSFFLPEGQSGALFLKIFFCKKISS